MTKTIDISTGATLEDDGVSEGVNEGVNEGVIEVTEHDKIREIAKAYLDYINLLNAELNETSPIAHAHGWRSVRAELGEQAREKINETLRKYGL
jgi:hypothetical protein